MAACIIFYKNGGGETVGAQNDVAEFRGGSEGVAEWLMAKTAKS